MVKLSSAIIFGLLLASVVTLILVPVFYARALRRREKRISLRGYVLRDEQLRQALLGKPCASADREAAPAPPGAEEGLSPGREKH